MELGQLITIKGDKIKISNGGFNRHLRKKGIDLRDPNTYDVVSIHNHTKGMPGSPCAQSYFEDLIIKASNSPITHIVITDHENYSNALLAYHQAKKIPGLDVIIGIESKTQYDEFNIMGLKPNPEDLEKILNVKKSGKHTDFDSLMNLIDEFNQKPEYQGNRILKGFNHPFSSQVMKSLENLSENIRSGFDFKGYILDHWNNDAEIENHIVIDEKLELEYQKFTSKNPIRSSEDFRIRAKEFLKDNTEAYKFIVEKLSINEFVDNYLLNKNYIKNGDKNRFRKHETIMKGLMKKFNYVEFNTTNYRHEDNVKAIKLAEKYDVPVLLGEDSHRLEEVSEMGYNIVPKGMSLAQALDEGKAFPVLTTKYDMSKPKNINLLTLKRRNVNAAVRTYNNILKCL